MNLPTFDFLKWLYPGMHIKRWLVLMVIGVAMMTFGLSYLVREAYLEGLRLPGFMYWATLQFIPRYVRGVMYMAAAVGLILYGIYKFNQSVISALAPNRDNTESLVNTIYNQRFLRRGPKIVAIGGGTGLSTLLRGLKEYTGNLTAVVTVADDGGSSGVLRRELGVLPPGDVRNCIAALADAEPLVTRLFQYRFEDGTGLAGHSFGNLFIVAMSGVTGNFEDAIRQTSRVLAVRGQIIPSTLENVNLHARTSDGRVTMGESNITSDLAKQNGDVRIDEVYLQPRNPPAHPEAVRAILDADLIILGPGSLYTSVLPNLLVQGIRRSLTASSAPKVYVCNVATQHGETDGFSVRDHIAAIEAHMGKGFIHYVLANDNVSDTPIPKAEQSRPVQVDDGINNGIRLVKADVVSEENRYHHDSEKLAAAVMDIYYGHDASRLPQPESEEEQLVSALDQ
jgi:uncharacterized cofD-like protein